jgi:hypothetical protein
MYLGVSSRTSMGIYKLQASTMGHPITSFCICLFLVIGHLQLLDKKVKFIVDKTIEICNTRIMRMWMINPKYMCNKHLVGEHGEIHKHRWCFERKQSVKGRIFPNVQIEPSSMKMRHDDLAREMLDRGMNHQSPYEMPDISYLPNNQRYAKVDVNMSFIDLVGRCDKCKQLIKGEDND